MSPYRMRAPRPSPEPEPERVEFDDEYLARMKAKQERKAAWGARFYVVGVGVGVVVVILAVVALIAWDNDRWDRKLARCRERGGNRITRDGDCIRTLDP